MLKAAALIGIVSLGALLGARAAARLDNRDALLKTLSASIETLTQRIAYSRLPLRALIAFLPGERRLWQAYAEALFTVGEPETAWRNARREILNTARDYTALLEEDWGVLQTFALTLGQLDARAQEHSGSSALSALGRQREDAEKQSRSKGRIYRLLGFSCGAAVAILLI